MFYLFHIGVKALNVKSYPANILISIIFYFALFGFSKSLVLPHFH